MDWTPGQMSSDIEDRRAATPAVGAGLAWAAVAAWGSWA